MHDAAPSSRSPVLLQTPWKASATGNFANASRRVPRAAYAVTLLATRRPNLSLFRPKGSLSAHYSTPRLASSPERTSEIASGTVPDRIFAASPEISPSGRVSRYKYLFSRREQRLSNFAWIRFVFESDILKRGNFSSHLGIWGFFFFNARFSIYKYFLQ